MTKPATEIMHILDSFLANELSLPHAYVFLGQSAAAELARNFAQRILHIEKLSHVDLVEYDAMVNGTIDEAREILRSAAIHPVKANRKVVLLKHMESANANILNSLLKTLEEPPQHTVLLLVSSRPLLPTVMSRCQIFSVAEDALQDIPDAVAQSLHLLEQHVHTGLAERLALVTQLADLEDATLQQTIELWVQQQAHRLADQPHTFSMVRAALETLQALKGSFNKKMVLQQFVTTAFS